MERFQQTSGTHGTVPLLTQHVSPQGSCTLWCSAWPSGWWIWKPVAGLGRSVLWAPIPLEPGLWGPSSGCHCGSVNSYAYLDLQCLLLSILQHPGRTWPPCLGPVPNRWTERAPLSPHLCQPVSLWQVAFALSAQTGHAKKLGALNKQERLAAGRY